MNVCIIFIESRIVWEKLSCFIQGLIEVLFILPNLLYSIRWRTPNGRKGMVFLHVWIQHIHRGLDTVGFYEAIIIFIYRPNREKSRLISVLCCSNIQVACFFFYSIIEERFVFLISKATPHHHVFVHCQLIPHITIWRVFAPVYDIEELFFAHYKHSLRQMFYQFKLTDKRSFHWDIEPTFTGIRLHLLLFQFIVKQQYLGTSVFINTNMFQQSHLKSPVGCSVSWSGSHAFLECVKLSIMVAVHQKYWFIVCRFGCPWNCFHYQILTSLLFDSFQLLIEIIVVIDGILSLTSSFNPNIGSIGWNIWEDTLFPFFRSNCQIAWCTQTHWDATVDIPKIRWRILRR